MSVTDKLRCKSDWLLCWTALHGVYHGCCQITVLTMHLADSIVKSRDVEGRREGQATPAHLHIWLVLDSVEVLMQAIQQEGQQLLTVLLAIPLKLGSKPAKLVLEVGWGHRSCLPLHSKRYCIKWSSTYGIRIFDLRHSLASLTAALRNVSCIVDGQALEIQVAMPCLQGALSCN